MLYLTADLHINHKLMARIRGFGEDVQAMNESILASWNGTVGPKDTVYIVGDVAMNVTPEVIKLLKACNGSKVLIPGNHDHSGMQRKLAEVMDVRSRLEVIKQKTMVYLSGGSCCNILALCHYPMMCWPGDGLAFGHLHGTTHHTDFSSYYDDKNAADVGWDVYGKPLPIYDFPFNKVAKKQADIASLWQRTE